MNTRYTYAAALLATWSLAQEPGPLPRFVDVAAESGLTLMNLSGNASKDYILEITGNGAGFVDFDGDQDLDVLIVNGSTLERYPDGGDPMAALYENVDGRFTDATGRAGLTTRGWGMGTCVADYDNDGDPDIYLTAYGPNTMYRNEGDGTFLDVTAAAGTGNARWGASCAFGDYDRDGWVDLYVANYVAFDDSIPARGGTDNCFHMGVDIACGPLGLEGAPDVLYHNNGNGTFTDRTAAAGIEDAGSYGLGVVFTDLDNDGWPDIYVANDSVPNFLFRNDGGGGFTETGLLSGTSLGISGKSQAGMGIGLSDYDGNGYFDIFVTNFIHDTNTLYRNQGQGLFFDATYPAGLSQVSLSYIGWGVSFEDLDNDGWGDLFIANGHTYPQVEDLDIGDRYLQPKEVHRNNGEGGFENVTASVGEDVSTPYAARGLAAGDYDNDGDIDLVAVNLGARPSLFRNDGGNRGHWLSLRLEGTDSNRDGIGARIELDAGGRTRVGEVRSGGSFESHNDLRVHFGLGAETRAEAIRILWPSGLLEEIGPVESDQFLRVREGDGIVAE